PQASNTWKPSARSHTTGGWPRMATGSYCWSFWRMGSDSGTGNSVTILRSGVSTLGMRLGLRSNSRAMESTVVPWDPAYNICVRLVQLLSPSGEPRVAYVDGEQLHLVNRCDSVYALCQAGLRDAQVSTETLDYDPVYRLESEWRLLPPWTHPEPARCLVSGTG